MVDLVVDVEVLDRRRFRPDAVTGCERVDEGVDAAEVDELVDDRANGSDGSSSPYSSSEPSTRSRRPWLSVSAFVSVSE